MKSSRLVPQQPEDDNMTDVEGLEGKPVASEKLWVEKYQPKGYRDLLSDEVVQFYKIYAFSLRLFLIQEYKQNCSAVAENVGSHRLQHENASKENRSQPRAHFRCKQISVEDT